MTSNLADMAVFARVVEAESFTGAARALGLSKSAVSKQVARLEADLGVRLLQRTTRRLSLTGEGATFFEGCQRMLAEASEAEAAVTHLAGGVRGRLRINAPMTFGVLHLAPLLPAFCARHPELEVELSLNDRRVDLIEEGYDVGLRIGGLPSSSLIARRLATSRPAVCASPAYLARNGRPERPEDLRAHVCLIYSYLDPPKIWRFRSPRGPTRVTVSGPLETNNGEVLLQAALAGQGIARLPSFIVGPALLDGRLIELLSDWQDPREPAIYVVYPERRHLAPKVRAFVDFVAERITDPPPWEPSGQGRERA